MPPASPIVSPAPSSLGRALRFCAGFLFTVLLVFAPLNFGSTRAGGIELLAGGCALASLLWAASLLCPGHRPRVPPWAAGAAALFTVAALPWIAGLAAPTAVAPFTSSHFARVAVRWPNSIVWHTPASTLLLMGSLTAATLALTDLARSRGWALAFSVALVVTAVAVGLLALLQNYTHAAGIYWRDDGRLPSNFAGTFYHHTSLGAYLNTAWPVAFALAALAWDRLGADSGFVAALAATLAVVILLAAHGSHVSRLPQLLAVVVAPLLLLRRRSEVGRDGFGAPSTRTNAAGRDRPALPRMFKLCLGAGALAAIVLLIAVGGRTADIADRWRLMFVPAPAVATAAAPPESAWPALVRDDLFIASPSTAGGLGDRAESWRTALRSIAARPLTGHGPANWIGAASQHTTDPFVRTFYQSLQFAYQDPLQTAVEWGLPAALGWWTLFLGAIAAVIRPPLRPAPSRPLASPAFHVIREMPGEAPAGAERPFPALRETPSRVPSRIALAAACGLVALLAQSLFDFPFQIPAIAFNAVVLAALAWSGAGRAEPNAQR